MLLTHASAATAVHRSNQIRLNSTKPISTLTSPLLSNSPRRSQGCFVPQLSQNFKFGGNSFPHSMQDLLPSAVFVDEGATAVSTFSAFLTVRPFRLEYRNAAPITTAAMAARARTSCCVLFVDCVLICCGGCGI